MVSLPASPLMVSVPPLPLIVSGSLVGSGWPATVCVALMVSLPPDSGDGDAVDVGHRDGDVLRRRQRSVGGGKRDGIVVVAAAFEVGRREEA